MKKVELDYASKKLLQTKMTIPQGEPEMSENQTAFLCGLLRAVRPKRIVEVGVAGGGTTAIMLQCLEEIGQPYQMFSVDVCEKFYRDPSKATGWLAEEAKEKLRVQNHRFLLGQSLPFFLEEIVREGEIDFLLLDTAHTVPGEILDFLLMLPHLSDGAVVCMHDVSLNIKNGCDATAIATNALFNAAVGEKYINLDLESAQPTTYPNIAAFAVTADTRKYVENVFGTLTLTWGYIPGEQELALYRNYYAEHYEAALLDVFDRASARNKMLRTPLMRRVKKAAKIMIKGRL